MSSDKGETKKSRRIRVNGASGKQDDKELQEMFSKFGEVKIEPHNRQEGVLIVSMETVAAANSAVAELDGAEFQGGKLALNNDSAQRRYNNNYYQQYPRSMYQHQHQHQHQQQMMMEYPLRLLVSSEHVGPVIGKGGESIKEITSKSKARVDVRREVVQWMTPSGRAFNCQIVFITGTPEACTSACKEIMSVCMTEAKDKAKDEIELYMLAEDRFCGRIIGKDGKNLKVVRENTNTSIHLANSPTVTQFEAGPNNVSMDRIVTVRGSLDGACAAQAAITEKLRQCHQMEMPHYRPMPMASMPAPPQAQQPLPPPPPPPPPPIAMHGHHYHPMPHAYPPGWPYVTFTAMDPRRRVKNGGIAAR